MRDTTRNCGGWASHRASHLLYERYGRKWDLWRRLSVDPNHKVESLNTKLQATLIGTRSVTMAMWRKNCHSLLLLCCCWWDAAVALAPAPVNRRNALLSSCGAAVTGVVTSWATAVPGSVVHANDDDTSTTTTTKLLIVQGTVILAPDAVVDASFQETAAECCRLGKFRRQFNSFTVLHSLLNFSTLSAKKY